MRKLLKISVFVSIAVAIGAAQTRGGRERFTGSPSTWTPLQATRTGAGTAEIVVERWSPDAERDRLLTVLTEKGPVELGNFGTQPVLLQSVERER